MSRTPPPRCGVCARDPNRMNSDIAECSHVECPKRRRAWSDRVIPRPRPARPDNDTEKPLNKVFPN